MRRVEAYLAALTDHPSRRAALREAVASRQPETPDTAMAALHDALAGDHHSVADPAEAELIGRIEAAYPALAARRTAGAVDAGLRGASMPGMARRSMSPAAMDRRPWRFISRLLPGLDRRLRLPRAVPSRLRGVVRWRQLVLFFLVALPAAGARG